MGPPTDDRRNRAAFLAAAVVAATWCAAFLVWQALGPGDPAHVTLVGDLAPLVPVALAVGFALRARSDAQDQRARSAWTLMALAFSAYLGATLLWAWFELVRHVEPFPSLADVGYLAFYPLLLLGLLRLPGSTRIPGERLRLVLDVTIVLLAGTMAVWYFVIAPTAQGGELLALSTILSLAYPVGDLVLIFGLATLLLRGSASSPAPALRVLMGGCCAFIAADIGFAHLNLNGTYASGAWPDAFWMVAWTAIVVGLVMECRVESRAGTTTGPRAAGPSHIALLPYIAVGGALTLALAVMWTTVSGLLRGLLVVTAAIIATVILRQVTAQRDNVRLMRQLHSLATTDPLTRLANRRHFLDVAAELLAAGGDVCLVMADLDHFKSINDTYGHGAGDEVLSWVAERCRTMLPADAIVGRLGGDEFVALLPGRPLMVATHLAEQLAAAIAGSVRPVAGGPEHVVASLGVASATESPDVVSLLHAADTALYSSKRSGGGRASAHHGPVTAWPRVPVALAPA